MEIPGDVYKILCLRGLKWVINNKLNIFWTPMDLFTKLLYFCMPLYYISPYTIYNTIQCHNVALNYYKYPCGLACYWAYTQHIERLL